LGLKHRVDYDIYYTNGPSSGVGNGLGGRTNGLALEGYQDLLYSAGNLGVNTISNGDFDNNGGDDMAALLNWMSAGNKDMFITGDDVASDLGVNAGASGVGFMENVLGVNVSTYNVRSFISNQSSPLVRSVAGNAVFRNIDQWIAYGGCFGINYFDGVTVRGGAARLAEFSDPNGNAGAYPFSAATLNIYNSTNRIISLPYDLMYVYTDPGTKLGAPLPDRAQLLADVLDYFGVIPTALPSSVPALGQFAITNYPNPFNPVTRLDYKIKSAGHFTLKIFNVRGQLVRTLFDGPVETDGFVIWDGADDSGASVASGVYFNEGRMGGEVLVGKMVLVK
jgi:hypothetical protein